MESLDLMDIRREIKSIGGVNVILALEKKKI